MSRRTHTGPLDAPDDPDEDAYPLVRSDIDRDTTSSEFRLGRRRWYPDGTLAEELAIQRLVERAPPPTAAPIAYPREVPSVYTTDQLTPADEVAVAVMIFAACASGWLGYNLAAWLGAVVGAVAGLLTLSTLLSGAGGLRERVRSLWMLIALLVAMCLGAALGGATGGYTGSIVGALIAGLAVTARLPL